MADEIPNQNVVNVTCEGSHWRARIGPEGLGISILAHDPTTALMLLASAAQSQGWLFDPSFRPKPERVR